MGFPRRIPTPNRIRAIKGTNADDLGKALGSPAASKSVGGRKSAPIPKAGIALEMAMGTNESRAALARFYSQLDDAGKRQFLLAVAKEYPPAQGNGLSVSAKKIMDVASGQGLDPEALKAAEAASVGKGRTTADRGVKSGEAYVADNPTDEFVDIDDPTAINYQGADETQGPSPLMRRDLPAGYDPKSAGVKDPNTDKATSSIDNRPRLRGPEKVPEIIDNPKTGRPRTVVYANEGKGAVGSQDIKPISQGREYEAAVEANVGFQRDARLQEFGSQEGIDQAIRAAEENPEIQAVFDRVKAQANKAHLIPSKPYPVGDGAARASERSAQNDYDGYVRQLVFGRPNSPIYKEVSSGADPLHNAVNEILIRGKNAGPKNLDPIVNRRFNSPEELAAALIRNASPEMFDMPPITPSQRMLAGDIVRELDPKYPKTMLEDFGLPMRQADRQELMRQAEAQLADVIRKRYGDQWGADYSPSPASDLVAAPESRVPEAGVGTSQNLADIPEEMGRPNTRGEQPVIPRKDYSQPPEGTDVSWEIKNDAGLGWQRQNSPEELAEARADIRNNRESAAASAASRSEQSALAEAEGRYKPGRSYPDQKPPPKTKAKPGKKAEQQHYQSYGVPKSEGGKGMGVNEDWFADYNDLMRDIPDTEQARRAAFARRLEGTIEVDDARSADVRREIAEIEAQMQHNPGLITPEKEARLQQLRYQLQLTRRLDALSGIRSHSKGPARSLDDINAELGGMDDAPVVNATPTRGQAVDPIPKAKERAQQAIADLLNKRVKDKRRASAVKVLDQLEKQGKALKGEVAAKFESEVLVPAREALAQSAEARAARNANPKPQPEPDPAARVEEAVEADQIDPLESAATELDEAPAPVRNKEKPPRAEAEAEAAARVDEQKAPEDAEAARPSQEASTTPDEKSKTPKDQPPPPPSPKTPPRRGLISGAAKTAALVGLGAGAYMTGKSINKTPAPSMDAAWNSSPEDSVGGVDTQSGMLADPAMSDMLADPRGGALSSEDRIRMIQQRPAFTYNPNTRTLFNWTH